MPNLYLIDTILCIFQKFSVEANSKILEPTKRLTPAYFLPNCKYFDQFFQTVKNKTTVLNLIFKEFSQTTIPPLISVLYANGYHDFPLKICCLTVPKPFVEEPFCAVFQKISGSEKVYG